MLTVAAYERCKFLCMSNPMLFVIRSFMPCLLCRLSCCRWSTKRFLLNTFYRATLCVSVVSLLSPGVRPSLCPSVWHDGALYLYPHGWRYRQTSFSAR